MGDGGGGHWLVRMECRPGGWSVCLPLLISPCTIKSRSSLLAPAHPGGPGERAVKWLWWWWLVLKMLHVWPPDCSVTKVHFGCCWKGIHCCITVVFCYIITSFRITTTLVHSLCSWPIIDLLLRCASGQNTRLKPFNSELVLIGNKNGKFVWLNSTVIDDDGLQCGGQIF